MKTTTICGLFLNHLSHCFSLRTVIIEMTITQTTVAMIVVEDIELRSTTDMTPIVAVIATEGLAVEAKTAEIETAIVSPLPVQTISPIATTMKTTIALIMITTRLIGTETETMIEVIHKEINAKKCLTIRLWLEV